MHKTEAQHNQPQNDATASSRQGASLESPQGETTTQLEAMAQRAPQTHKQAQLATQINASPALATQHQQIKHIHNSPSMTAQRKFNEAISPLSEATTQRQQASTPPNNTGLPDNLKSGVESLSGMSLDHVKVHYNSAKPAQLNALAYAQGSDIHVAPRQEQHLPHETWHVVQQAQGRVKPTVQMKNGIPVNDDQGLEREADIMGAKALASGTAQRQPSSEPTESEQKTTPALSLPHAHSKVAQALTGFEAELHVPVYGPAPAERAPTIAKEDTPLSGGERTQIKNFLAGGLKYGRTYGFHPDGYYDISADHGGYAIAHSALISKLLEGGYLGAGFFARSMTNIEYRTQPLEERAKGADARTDLVATAVKSHATSTAGKAVLDGQQDVAAPALDLKTGVPKSALDKLVSNGSGGVKNAVATAKDAVNPFIYYQTTTGVLPSEIPELFKESSTDIVNNAGGIDKLTAKQKGAVVVMNGARVIASQVMTSNKADFIRANSAFKSLTGWVTLLTQYMLSYQLERTDFRPETSTVKNLVGYLSKTPVHQTLLAVPVGIRPNFSNDPPKTQWVALFIALVEAVNNSNLETKTGLSHVDVAQGRIPDPKTWLGKVIQGIAGGEINSGHKLGLDAGQEALTPALNIPGEQAIPLEDRYSMLKSKAEELAPDQADAYLKAAWDKAVARRQKSTVSPETKTNEQDEDNDDKYTRMRAEVGKVLDRAENKHGVGGPTLVDLKDRFNRATSLLPSWDDDIIPVLTTLQQDIHAAINTVSATRNTESHKWIEANYRGIEYNWKDADNYTPTLRNAAPDVYIKKGGKLEKATKRGGYLQYQQGITWTKIERNLATVKKYLAENGSSWID